MAGEGALFFFHGAYNEKRDAVRKEAETPGSFIQPIYYRSGMRHAVLSPHRERNPEGHAKIRLTRISRGGKTMWGAEVVNSADSGGDRSMPKGRRNTTLTKQAAAKLRALRSWAARKLKALRKKNPITSRESGLLLRLHTLLHQPATAANQRAIEALRRQLAGAHNPARKSKKRLAKKAAKKKSAKRNRRGSGPRNRKGQFTKKRR